MRKLILSTASAFTALAAAITAQPASAALVFYFDKPSFLAAVPGAQLIEDMEGFSDKDNFSYSTIAFPQITFEAAPGFNIGISSPGYTNYDLGGAPTTSSILTATGDESFGGLTMPVVALGMDVYYNDFGPATFTFFDGATNLGSITITTAPGFADNLGFLGVRSSSSSITNFTFVSTNGRTLNTGIDNVLVAVPEPATWAMLIAGFGLVGGAMRARAPKPKTAGA